tara:strand:+ start:278 stop:547 length:270 start_codon:yes stop_codon:yes gene_type:complete
MVRDMYRDLLIPYNFLQTNGYLSEYLRNVLYENLETLKSFLDSPAYKTADLIVIKDQLIYIIEDLLTSLEKPIDRTNSDPCTPPSRPCG